MILTPVLAWAAFGVFGAPAAGLQSEPAPQVQLKFPPKPADTPPSNDFLTWHGWQYLQGTTAKEPQLYDSQGDWGEIQAKYTTASKADKPAQWKLKIVLFTRTESDDRDAGGVLRENRQTIEATQLTQVLEAIERFKAWVVAKFDGRVVLVPTVSIESEWMRGSVKSNDCWTSGKEFTQKYLEARINGGSYEAEDKVFRGPYNSVLFVVPGSLAAPIPPTVVNGTPVNGLSVSPLGADGLPKSFERSLQELWLGQVSWQAHRLGYKATTMTAGAAAGENPWPTVTSVDPAAAQARFARISSSLELGPAVADPPVGKVWLLAPAAATLANDNDRGQVLRIVEASGERAGGTTLPARADGKPIATLDATATLSFSVKSTSRDPIAIRLQSSDGKTMWVSVGRDPLVVTPSGATVVSVPFTPNGQWQKVTIDLKKDASAAGLTDVAAMAIEPSPNAKLAGKLRPDPVDYAFDEFKFTADAGQPTLGPVEASVTSDDDEARALYAAKTKTSDTDLGKLLKDKSELVRLNAVDAYKAVKDPSVVTALESASMDLDPTISSTALQALMNQGTDAAINVVQRAVRVGLSDYQKQVAARLLAETKDPKQQEYVSLLFNNRSWQTRLSAVESLSLFATPQADLMRLAFVNNTDPEIKLAVTRYADPSQQEDLHMLAWSAVNEPSDMVRASSYIKLIQSPNAANRTDGYKGVRDDSEFVRLQVTEYLSSTAKEEGRDALRLAIADRSPMVRAAAIRGFAALEKGATSEEVANVMDDQDPAVQLALIDLSKRRSLKLPQKTLDAMVASPDTEVSSAAKALGH